MKKYVLLLAAIILLLLIAGKSMAMPTNPGSAASSADHWST